MVVTDSCYVNDGNYTKVTCNEQGDTVSIQSYENMDCLGAITHSQVITNGCNANQKYWYYEISCNGEMVTTREPSTREPSTREPSTREPSAAPTPPTTAYPTAAPSTSAPTEITESPTTAQPTENTESPTIHPTDSPTTSTPTTAPTHSMLGSDTPCYSVAFSIIIVGLFVFVV
eukprot:UN08694